MTLSENLFKSGFVKLKYFLCNRVHIFQVQALAVDSDSDTEMDVSYNPDEDASIADMHPGSSSIVLNPVLRRQRRAERD